MIFLEFHRTHLLFNKNIVITVFLLLINNTMKIRFKFGFSIKNILIIFFLYQLIIQNELQ